MNRTGEFLWNDRHGRARGLADSQRQMARGAAHDDNEIPAAGGARIFHEISH